VSESASGSLCALPVAVTVGEALQLPVAQFKLPLAVPLAVPVGPPSQPASEAECHWQCQWVATASGTATAVALPLAVAHWQLPLALAA
jgi:hypothetical protein